MTCHDASVLALLDLSVAFDIGDHGILVSYFCGLGMVAPFYSDPLPFSGTGFSQCLLGSRDHSIGSSFVKCYMVPPSLLQLICIGSSSVMTAFETEIIVTK